MTPYLSVIIPAHNEAERIGKTLRAVHHYLKVQRYAWEIIVVDDGSTDLTASVVHNASVTIPNLSLIQLSDNLGKGAAVREGVLAARGTARLFTDADNSTPIQEVAKLLPYLEQGFDVVIGSRRIDGAIIHVRQDFVREILGASFRALTRLTVPLPIKDTQNGFKLFSASAANDLFKNLRTHGWSFDLEILKRARDTGLNIKEVPIEWTNDRRSRLNFLDMLRMASDLLTISAN